MGAPPIIAGGAPIAPGAPIIAGVLIVIIEALPAAAAPGFGELLDEGVVVVGVGVLVVGFAPEPAVACGVVVLVVLVVLEVTAEPGWAGSGSLPQAAATRHSSAGQRAQCALPWAARPKHWGVRSRIAHTSARMNKVLTRLDAISAESWWILS